jgi:rhodanese-related sulfurtransferase
VAGDVEVVVDDFVEAFKAARSIPEDALLVLLDEDGSLAGRAAAALAGAEVSQPKLYVVKGGAAAWQVRQGGSVGRCM